MVGRNLREEFRRTRLRWTAIDYHAKYCDYAGELATRQSAGGIDRLSQSVANTRLDLTPHQIKAELFALRNPLQQSVVLANEVGLGKTIDAARWCSASTGLRGPAALID
jgi:N12 class adenine-specific DNA methylase